MYPAVVAWLHAGPLPWLALLVPKPGILYAVVLLACGVVFVHRVTKVGIGQDQALEALLAAAVGALVGTRRVLPRDAHPLLGNEPGATHRWPAGHGVVGRLPRRLPRADPLCTVAQVPRC